MTGVAEEFRGPQFDRYVAYMEPIAQAMARRRSRGHPLLSPEDQAAYALEVCLRVWQRYQRVRPGTAPESLYPIAVTAIDRRLRRRLRSATKLGEAEVFMLSLDGPAWRRRDGGDAPTLGDVVADPALPPAEGIATLWPARRVTLRRPLRPDEVAVFQELLTPSDATATAARELWGGSEQRDRRWNWPTARTRIVAAGLGWTVERARSAYHSLRECAEVEFYNGEPLSAKGHNGVMRVEIVHRYEPEKTEGKMTHGTDGVAPTDPAAEGTQAAEPAETETKKKARRDGHATKPKTTPQRGPKLAPGAKVVYAGGSKVDALRAGAKGTVRRAWPAEHPYHQVYYGVRFGEGDKAHYHVLHARYLKAAE